LTPCTLNAIIAAISNHLFTTLSEEDFALVSVFFSELGKSMFAMKLFKSICSDNRRDRK
jgi:hypothetical protein